MPSLEPGANGQQQLQQLPEQQQLPELRQLLPLREPTLFILLSLAGGEKHGYAIIKTVEDLSRGKLRLSTGTLYEALARLLEQELIERVDGDPEEDEPRGRRRKAYRLTELGRRILAAETARMRDLLTIARSVLGAEQG